MQALGTSLPVDESRELLPFEADEVFPAVGEAEHVNDVAAFVLCWPCEPAQACTDIGCDALDSAGPGSPAEARLVWAVGLGIGSALLSLFAVLLPI